MSERPTDWYDLFGHFIGLALVLFLIWFFDKVFS